MSEQIKSGDMVVMVRQCCSARNSIGSIFRVASLDHFFWECPYCHSTGSETKVIAESPFDMGYGPHTHAPLSWLKRIPPLSELEGEKEKKEITA